MLIDGWSIYEAVAPATARPIENFMLARKLVQQIAEISEIFS